MRHLLSILLISLPFYLLAQHSEQIRTERPLTTGNPFTVGKSVLQVEGGYVYGYLPVGTYISTNRLQLQLRYGLTERLEVYAGLDQNWWLMDRVRIGASDRVWDNLGGLSNIGLKLNLFTDLGLINNLSIQSDLRAPVFGEQVLSGYGSFTTLKGNIPIGKRWDIRMSASLAYVFGQEGAQNEAVLLYAVATTFSPTAKWTTFLELNPTNYPLFESARYRGGAMYKIHENLQLDVAFGYADDWYGDIYIGSLGAAYRLGWR